VWEYESTEVDIFIKCCIVFANVQCVMLQKVLYITPYKLGMFGPVAPKKGCCKKKQKSSDKYKETAKTDAGDAEEIAIDDPERTKKLQR